MRRKTLRVIKAQRKDIAEVMGWLEREHIEDGGGFWCNWPLIAKPSNRPDISIIRSDGRAVAFQLGTYSADILSVRKEFRKMGLGTALVDASVKRALRAGVNVLRVTCEPKTSLSFWEKMGFVRYGKHDAFTEVRVRRVLSRTFDVPIAQSAVVVVIEFYPESALYGSAGEDVLPITQHRVVGVHASDGSILLGQRIVGLWSYGKDAKDTVVKVEIDGLRQCFCKAKCEQARAIGVQSSSLDCTYFIDSVAPSKTQQLSSTPASPTSPC